jgi:hypothetical protein
MVNKGLIHYFVLCVDEFARQKNISPREAFQYLYDYQGITHLLEFYDIEHTLPMNDTINGLSALCRKNGGTLA